MMAAIPFIVASVLIVPDVLGEGMLAVVSVAVVSVLLALGAIACWRYPDKLPDWFWLAVPTAATGFITWLDLVTKDAGVTGQFFFLWPVLYAATFLRRAYGTIILSYNASGR